MNLIQMYIGKLLMAALSNASELAEGKAFNLTSVTLIRAPQGCDRTSHEVDTGQNQICIMMALMNKSTIY